VRSEFDSRQLSSPIRQALRTLNSSLPVYVDTWSQGLELAQFPSRMAAIALGVIGLMGAMLSITGTFGTAYSVSKRLRELGIRMALGAQRKEVLRAALGRPKPSDSSTVVSFPGIPYALAFVNHGFDNDLTIYRSPLEPLGKPGPKWQKIIDANDGVVNFDVHEDDLYLITHKDAPRFKVINTSLAHPDLPHARTVISPGEAVITNLTAVADALYVQKLDGGMGKLSRVEYPDGPATEISLPINGSIELFGGDPRLQGVFFGLATWTKAPNVRTASTS
jgi:hypothetical protein